MTDRPWAMTLAGLGARRRTGQLTLHADGKQYRIVFDHGAVIGATSPLASDSAARIALLHQVIAPGHLAELTRRIAAAPERDEIEVLADAARLTLDQALRLRRKVIEQRAARTFSVDEGELVIDSKIDVPILSGISVDVRSVIYSGARMNLSAPRLGSDLRQLGARFVLRPDAIGELEHFGFTEAEQPILEALRAGTSVAELEARHRDLDPCTIRAVIYSLVSCAICTGDAPTPPDVYSRTRTGRRPSDPRTFRQTPLGGLTALQRPPAGGTPRAPAARAPAARAPAGAPDEAGVPRTPRTGALPPISRTKTPRGPSSATAAGGAGSAGTAGAGRTAARMPSSGAPAAKRSFITGGSPAIGRTPTPGGAPAIGRTPTPGGAPANGRTPTPVLDALLRGEKPPGTAVPASDRLAAAKEAYRRGQARLRVENLEDAIADLTRAVELAPSEVDYAATLAWARFCQAANKQPLEQITRDALGRAIRRSQTPEVAQLYLGRVERMLGRDKEALRHFKEILEAQPKHAEAAAEVRAIEARMTRESGLFGRKR